MVKGVGRNVYWMGAVSFFADVAGEMIAPLLPLYMTVVLGAPPVFLFEPHQTEQCNWKPDVLLDITPVWEKKSKAFELMAAQEHLWEYYTRVGLQRGVQAARNSESKNIKYGEAYQRVFPHVVEAFS